jgi:hypothetical protein
MTTPRRREFYLAEPERFYVSTLGGGFREIIATPICLAGELDTFLVENLGKYYVCIGCSGGVIGQGRMNSPAKGCATPEEAIEKAQDWVNKATAEGWGALRERLARTVIHRGLSPRYAYYPEDDA